MSDQQPATNSGNEPQWLTQPFSSWLKTQTTLFYSQMLGVIGFLSFILSLISKHIDALDVQMFVDYAHIVIVGIFIVALFNVLDDNKRGAKQVKEAHRRVFNESLTPTETKVLMRDGQIQLRRFKYFFLIFWIGMLALYITFAYKHHKEAPAIRAKRVEPAKQTIPETKGVDLPANLPAAAQPAVTASTPSAGSEVKSPKASSDRQLPPERPVRAIADDLFWRFMVFFFNNLTLLAAYWCFTILYLPSYDRKSWPRHRKLLNYSSLAVGAFTLAFICFLFFPAKGGFQTEDIKAYAAVFDGLSGTLNAVVLALLIARLDSKLIGLPSWLISVLYVYAAVQPLFVVFELNTPVSDIIQTFVLITVFIFKVYFFLIIIYTLQTGRLLNYLFCFPFLSNRMNSIFDNPYEIKLLEEKGHCFKISVLKKGKEIYSVETDSKNRRDCDRQVAQLQRVMKHKSSYQPDGSDGAYIIKVGRPGQPAVCESKRLESDDEMRGLIQESIEKIPYCKYSHG
ncbi:MAG TPA: hypothetical protein VJZ91_04970 [Blastocatellia bacterium]|nr:hypothetical protein [Blastocatellia bacterium]